MVKTNTNAIVNEKQLENKIKEVSPEELPSLTGNADKFLKVNADASGVEWDNIPEELPTIASGDAGKVVKVNAGETGYELGSVSGGTQLYVHTFKCPSGLVLRYVNGDASLCDTPAKILTSIKTYPFYLYDNSAIAQSPYVTNFNIRKLSSGSAQYGSTLFVQTVKVALSDQSVTMETEEISSVTECTVTAL